MKPVSFSGTYKIKIENNKREDYNKVFSFPSYEMRGETITKFPPEKECHTVIVEDKFDKNVESFLKQRGINYEKLSNYKLFGEMPIVKRMVAPKDNKDILDKLIPLNVSKFDKYYSKSWQYIDRDLKGAISGRLEGFENYLKTGLDIEAPTISLKEEENGLVAYFQDGRHRYAYMRKNCFEKVPFAMSEESFELAKKYGLLD